LQTGAWRTGRRRSLQWRILLLMRKYLAELIGTFALVFAGTGAIVINNVTLGKITGLGISLTFGLIVMAMIYAVGDVSGAHLNPAVTVGFWAARRFPLSEVLPYVSFQFAGALLASTALHFLFGGAELGVTHPIGRTSQSFILETILTFLLMFVIMNVACGSKEQGTMAGVAIGAVVALEAMFGGPISGASMNPARSLAPALVSGNLSCLWIYMIAPVLGAILAVFAFQAIHE
jgi:aquaporin Z